MLATTYFSCFNYYFTTRLRLLGEHVSMAEGGVRTTSPTRISHWRQVFDSAGTTPEVSSWRYAGSGTEDDPYAVTWIENDPRNPMLYSATTRWSLMMIVAMAALMVSLDSSAYSGSADEIMTEFNCSQEVFTLGISLFVLGFAIGPIM